MSTGAGKPRPPIGWLVLGAVTIALMLSDVLMIFHYAPVEVRMGVVQKIFYFHVPSAYGMYVGFGLCSIASMVFLVKRSEKWDALAVSSAEVGLVFCAVMLITGPLWGRKSWGVWWTWDPRLTTTLLAGMIFSSYVVLRSFGGAGEVERRFAAGLAIVGLFILPIIHYSVQRWRGVHPTVITDRGGGLAPEMLHTFLFSLVAFTALTAWLIWTRTLAERMQQELRALTLEAAELDLLADV